LARRAWRVSFHDVAACCRALDEIGGPVGSGSLTLGFPAATQTTGGARSSHYLVANIVFSAEAYRLLSLKSST